MSLKMLFISLPLSEMSVLASRQLGAVVFSPARCRVAGVCVGGWGGHPTEAHSYHDLAKKELLRLLE